MKTELVFILDRSGSMHGLEKDTIGGFNSLIHKQKREKGEAFVTCVLFNQEMKLIYDHENIKKMRPMNDKQYDVRGCTALYDALGFTIQHVEKVQKYQDHKPDKTMIVITTDGMENASHFFSLKQVRNMVEAKKEMGWEFLFLGANLDAIQVRKGFGIDEDRSVRYECDEKGTQLNYDVVNEAIRNIRKGKVLSESWKAPIERDYRKRHK